MFNLINTYKRTVLCDGETERPSALDIRLTLHECKLRSHLSQRYYLHHVVRGIHVNTVYKWLNTVTLVRLLYISTVLYAVAKS